LRVIKEKRRWYNLPERDRVEGLEAV